MLRIFVLTILLFFLLMFMFLVRNRKLELRYSIIWFMILIMLFMLAIFPSVLETISKKIGIEVPSNALFMIAFFLMIAIMVFLTVSVSELNCKLKKLIQELAIADEQIRELRKEKLRDERKD